MRQPIYIASSPASISNNFARGSGDAMFCQKSIVAKIVQRGGDYILPIKDNQKILLENVETAFNEPIFPPPEL